ncbi:amidohydrolase family protein [Inquilinus sp. CA228]|uniref:amidohydrolase family protein n=1 Tax=Inquilinus sp. CA228 TaxID=3455609 RepID=UPI003F8D0760
MLRSPILGRRAVLGGLLLAGRAGPAPGQPMAAALPPRIDVHAHYLPGFYREAAIAAGHEHPDGMPGLPKWDAGMAVAMMDQINIRTAMLSISSPGVHFGDDAAARTLARRVNEEAARAAADHPGRFGLFASLPLPDVDGALAEAAYAFDTLKADGVVIETNHHGVYPGDGRFDPLFAELDRRRAVVFMHPTSPHCPCCQTAGPAWPRPMLEFMFETTRAVTNLILTGTLDRFPGIRLIVPHAGAAVPVLADRVVGLAPALQLPNPVEPDHVFAVLRGLYYDLAGFPLPRLLPALLQIADPGRILYGSDWPFTPLPIVARLAQAQDTTTLLDDATRRRVLHGNALTLFPRFA